MFNFFKKRMVELDKNKKISQVNKDIKEEESWNPKVPCADESEINKIGIAGNDNVIFSGAVDSYSDSEDAKLARPDAPGVLKAQNDIKLAKFY